MATATKKKRRSVDLDTIVQVKITGLPEFHQRGARDVAQWLRRLALLVEKEEERKLYDMDARFRLYAERG